MNKRSLVPTLAIAIASIAATTVPAHAANGWGVGGTPPGFFNRLGGWNNNGMTGTTGVAGTGFGGYGAGQWHHHHHHHWMNNGNTAFNNGGFNNGFSNAGFNPGFSNAGFNNGYNNVAFNPGYGYGNGYGTSNGLLGSGLFGNSYNGYGNGYGTGTGTGGFLSKFFGTNGAPTAALTNRLAQRQTYLQGLLSAGNLPANRQSWIQNELGQITSAQNGIAAGTFNQSSLGRGGLRGLLGR